MSTDLSNQWQSINEPAREPETHDYSNRYWGHDYATMAILDDGQVLRLAGWGYGLNIGDYLILQNGAWTTRYRIEMVEYQLDPKDMWFVTARFAPRPNVWEQIRKQHPDIEKLAERLDEE